MKTAIVCGGRDYSDTPALFRALDELDLKYKIERVIDGQSDDVTGEYIGADYWANQWARARAKKWVRVRADWTKHGKLAGPFRNKRMLDVYRPDLVIYFPGGRGTEDMVKQAKASGVKTIPAFSWMRKR